MKATSSTIARLATVARIATRSVVPALLLLVLAGQSAAQQFLVLTPKWNIAPGSRYYLPTANGNPRAAAINKATGNVLIPSLLGGSNHVEVVSGVDGSDLGGLSDGGGIISGGFAALLGIGAADDGVIYAGNGDNATSGFKIYRWSAEDTTGAQQPIVAFGPAAPGPTVTRIGDSFFVRGAGTNTQIIASGTGSAYFTVFTTTDGTNFTANQIAVPTPPGAGAFSRTVAFDGTNNAFYGGGPNSATLYYINFNLGSLTATLVSNISLSLPIGMCAVRPAGTTRILAGIQDTGLTTNKSLIVYDMKDLTGPAAGGNVAFPAGGTADGNITGGTDIDAAKVVAFGTQGGVVALDYAFQATVAPSITSQSPGGTVFPPWDLSVSVSGTPTLRYQWQASFTNTSATFTNIPGANANVYTVTSPGTSNYYRAVITNTAGAATSAPVQLTVLTPTLSPVVTNLWRIAAGQSGYPYLSASDNSTRGLGYDALSNRVVVAGTSGGTAIHILDGNTGADLGRMDLSAANLGGGTFQIDQVVVADDGAVYSGNLAVANQSFTLNRWPAPTTNAVAYNAYSDSAAGGLLQASGQRFGDAMCARGAGANTQILLPSRSGTNVALLTTSDGLNFSAVLIGISGVPSGFAGQGVAFGTNNTFWAKSYLGHLWQIAFDPVAGTGSVLRDYASVSAYLTAVGVDPVRNILASVDLNPNYKPNGLQLFQLTGTTDPPVLFDQVFFAAANANGNQNAVVAMKYPRVYALDVNNGIVAATYGVPPVTAPVITQPPTDLTVYTNDPAATLTVGVSGSLPLYFQWRMNGLNIPGATNRDYVTNYPSLSASGLYDVVVRNIAGSVTSTPPAVFTVIVPAASSVVTQLWTLAAGSRPYLDGSSYSTRGLAYDTNTATVLLADHANIYVLSATNGSDLFQLNTVGLPAGYFTIDQVAAADDGAVYSCNLTLDGTGFAITRWSSVDTAATLSPAYGPGDPVGNGDRLGDTLAIRGAGAGTEILAGSWSGSNVVLFTTVDGLSFTPTTIWVTNAPTGFASQGISFGAGNTFWAKTPGYNLRQVAYDRGTGLGGVIQLYEAGTAVNSSMGGIGVDPGASVLGGVVFSDTPDDLQLLSLSGNTNPPVLFDQAFFGSSNPNSQFNAVSVLKGGRAFALNVNNGVVALSYGTPAVPVAIIRAAWAQGTGATITFRTFAGRSYQVEFKNALSDLSWTPVGPVITGSAETATYTDATAAGNSRYYRVHSQ